MRTKPSHSKPACKEEKVHRKRPVQKSHSSASVIVKDDSSSSTKGEELKKTITSAIYGAYQENRGLHPGMEEIDIYGKGSPTDRLQFGYAPAIAEEAIAFHSRYTARKWIEARRDLGRLAFVKKQKLPKTNCEPITSLLKLKNYWNRLEEFNTSLRGGHFNAQEADNLLEILASRQRVDNQNN
ncbi:unnamed protein product [Phytomonas sp. Hart1]|nr:unnamed protein product [Phytomonas sp. Hart1]|eukprot:CCW68560.1 unnamed protein product [Phytomonas sp. isolate Hart1]